MSITFPDIRNWKIHTCYIGIFATRNEVKNAFAYNGLWLMILLLQWCWLLPSFLTRMKQSHVKTLVFIQILYEWKHKYYKDQKHGISNSFVPICSMYGTCISDRMHIVELTYTALLFGHPEWPLVQWWVWPHLVPWECWCCPLLLRWGSWLSRLGLHRWTWRGCDEQQPSWWNGLHSGKLAAAFSGTPEECLVLQPIPPQIQSMDDNEIACSKWFTFVDNTHTMTAFKP